MTSQHLVQLAPNLEKAADIVEAIEDRHLQVKRGWDLSAWRYSLIPWGVRFIRHDDHSEVWVRASHVES